MIIHWAGYNIRRIPTFWQSMSEENANNFDFFSTHPSDDKRIAAMNEMIFEIENRTDFYSQPVLSDSTSTSSNILEKVPTLGTTNTGVSGIAATKNSHSANTCKYCGNIVKIDDIFCTNCGNKLNHEWKCSNCGSTVNKDDTFCFNCGNKI